MKKLYRLLMAAMAAISASTVRLQHFNPISLCCNHLVGKNHTHSHRMVVGTGIILLGVLISKSGIGLSGPIHLALDGIGYLVHGVGAIPYLEIIEKWSRKD
jgi:hypothetical protein